MFSIEVNSDPDKWTPEEIDYIEWRKNFKHTVYKQGRDKKGRFTSEKVLDRRFVISNA